MTVGLSWISLDSSSELRLFKGLRGVRRRNSFSLLPSVGEGPWMGTGKALRAPGVIVCHARSLTLLLISSKTLPAGLRYIPLLAPLPSAEPNLWEAAGASIQNSPRSLLLFSLRRDRSVASPPPLWGEDKGGGSRRPVPTREQTGKRSFENLPDPSDPPPLPAPHHRASGRTPVPRRAMGAGAQNGGNRFYRNAACSRRPSTPRPFPSEA